MMSNEELTPNYNIMLDSYISKCKTTYEEYKQVLILLITYTSINNKGRFVYYQGNLIKKLEEKRKAFNEAMERLNNFKELNSEHLEKKGD